MTKQLNEMKKYTISEMVERTPKLLIKLAGKISSEDLTDIIKESFKNIYLQARKDAVKKVINELPREIIIEIVRNEPYLIKEIKQDLELCKIALREEIKRFPNNCYSQFSELKYHDYEMAKMAVTDDASCYTLLKEEYKTEEVKLLAIKRDSRVLKNIENQTDEMVELAIKDWAKSIRWAKCPSLEKMQILAIETNLQAMPDKPVSGKVIDRFKELCIENNYFDEEWSPKFDLTQEQLYNMLRERKDWVESHLIYGHLDDEHLLKALKEGLIKYQFKSPEYRQLKPEILAYCLDKLHHIDVNINISRKTDEEIEEIVRINPTVIKHIPRERQTIDLCKLAVELDPSTAEFVKVMDEELEDKFIEHILTE